MSDPGTTANTATTAALERLAQTTLTLLDMLNDGLRRDPPAGPALAQTCLVLLLESLAVEMKVLATTSTPETSREIFAAVRQRIADYQRESVQVADHLIELSRGWRCEKCGADVAEAAIYHPTGAPLGLRCRACKSETVLHAAGLAEFQKWFGHLAAMPAWNPTANGFVV